MEGKTLAAPKPIDLLLERCRKNDVSDLHFTAGLPPMIRTRGSLIKMKNFDLISGDKIEVIANSMLSQIGRKYVALADVDFCFVSADGLRNRVNIYTQNRQPAIAIRLLNEFIPTVDDMGLPEIFKELALMPRGLLLMTGPTGSGKSTSLAAMINHININKETHILTFEDPIEYKHTHKRSMVNQREVGVDCDSFASALRSALREDPDVILVGEMRDLETTSSAITAAETGHFVMSTLHTTGAAATIDRIIDQYPASEQSQVRVLLAQVLRAVITQTLIPKADGTGRVAAFEIMICNDAIANMIRENKGHQIDSVLQTGQRAGMQSLDMHLARLVRMRSITYEAAIEKCVDSRMLDKFIGMT